MKTYNDVFQEVVDEFGIQFGSTQTLETAKIAAIRYAELACEEQRKICAAEYCKAEENFYKEKEAILNAPKPELK